jgi:hypothetical protein
MSSSAVFYPSDGIFFVNYGAVHPTPSSSLKHVSRKWFPVSGKDMRKIKKLKRRERIWKIATRFRGTLRQRHNTQSW